MCVCVSTRACVCACTYVCLRARVYVCTCVFERLIINMWEIIINFYYIFSFSKRCDTPLAAISIILAEMCPSGNPMDNLMDKLKRTETTPKSRLHGVINFQRNPK